MPATSEYPFPVGDLAQEPRSKRSKTHGSAYSAVAAGYPPPSLVSPPDQGLFSPQMFTPDDHAMSGILPSVHSPPVSTALLPTDRTLASPSEIHGGSSSIGRSDTFSLAFAPARPTQVELPTPPQEKGPQLRLPSFESLGIANAHPDALSLQVEKIVLEPLLDLSHALRDPSLPSVSSPNLHSLGGECHVCSSPSNRNPGPHPDLAFLTPPEEPKELVWSAHNATASSEERRLSDGGAGDVPIPAVSQTTLGTSTAAVEGLSVDDVASAATPSTTQPDVFQAAIHTILSTMSSGSFENNSLRILSHALPSPSTPGHVFPRIIDELRATLSARQLTWISLLHAVAGRFNLADLPVSPPSTPGIALAGLDTTEDYFTTTTFESAIHADYTVGDVARSTRYQPLAAPCTINLCIIERYIPPTGSTEFAQMFSFTRPSLLVDRMVEIQPGNGCICFLYPTRQGARDFCSKYLSPILDPLLRSMVVVNNFTADLSGAIGRMAGIEQMHDFEMLKRKIETLCTDMSSKNNPQVLKRLHHHPGSFSLVHAQKQHVKLERDVWTTWWVKQEKQRVRNAVSMHFRLANRSLADSDTTPTTIIQQILDGVMSRPYPEGQAPHDDIEIGVFVIKRGF